MYRIYTNIVVINKVEYTNIIKALNYKDALSIFKIVKKRSKNTFKGRLTFQGISN